MFFDCKDGNTVIRDSFSGVIDASFAHAGLPTGKSMAFHSLQTVLALRHAGHESHTEACGTVQPPMTGTLVQVALISLNANQPSIFNIESMSICLH